MHTIFWQSNKILAAWAIEHWAITIIYKLNITMFINFRLIHTYSMSLKKPAYLIPSL